VHLTFQPSSDGRWAVSGRVECGADAGSRTQTFATGACGDRVEAEQEALRQVGALLGHNVDRNTSRVTNWSEGGLAHADDRSSAA
jgi:hypothetical protein